jgi:hypothetical protein
MNSPGSGDDERTREEDDKFGEFEELKIDGGENKGNEDRKKIKGGDDY